MLVRSWGSRGSISVSGKEYLKYGGETSCIEIQTSSGDLIILDAGSGIRKLGNRLMEDKPQVINIFFTHAHWDHLSGFPFFKPVHATFSKINVYGPEMTQDSVRNILSKAMKAPYFPVELEDINGDVHFREIVGKAIQIGSASVETIALNHTNEGVGYKITDNGKTFVFLTDNELTHEHEGGASLEEYIEFSRGVDLLFHDAEYTPEDYKHTKGWGHSVYIDTVNMAIEAGVKTLGLFHHNQDRTDEGVDKILKHSKEIIKEKNSPMNCIAVSSETEIKL